MKSITLMLALLAAGCATAPCPVGGVPCPAPTPTATCETACLHGYNLGCDWAAPTPPPTSAPCTTVCANAALTVPWDVEALTKATTCTP